MFYILKEGKDINMIYIYRLAQYIFNSHKEMLHLLFNKMKTINPKCTDNDSFKYSILILLHYYDLYNNKERINKWNKYIKNYNFLSNNPSGFEINNSHISLTVYNDLNEIIYNSKNKSNNKASIIKINNRYHALKPDQDKFIKLKQLLKQFTHEELTEFILNNIIQS